METQNRPLSPLGNLERLAIVGTSGMGALTYRPVIPMEHAYDLTYSNSIGGEHATTIHGNGTNPGMKDILAVADGIGLNHARAKKIAEEIRECVYSMLGPYL